MKINVDIDVTPEEMRKLLGWPDIENLQKEAIAKVMEQMNAGAEGYDPMSLVQPFLAQSANSMENLQKMMAGMMGAGSKKDD